MKKFLLLAIKIVLAGLFLYNIHLFSFVVKSFHEAEQKAPPPFKADGGQEDFKYLNEKLRKAKALGPNYLAEEYFSDLTAIKLKEKKNDFDRSTILSINHTITGLLTAFNRNLMNLRGHDSDQAYKQELARLDSARNRSQEILEPGSTKRERDIDIKMRQPGYWPSVLASLFVWLGHFYLENFLLAFSLLWLWWYQEKASLRIKNPLSFLICLLLYPLTIGRVWYKLSRDNFRTLALKVEFRRRQTDLFSLISEDELADIRLFARSHLKIRDYRRYLDERGLYQRQALLPALAVTLLFLMVAPTFEAQAKTDQTGDKQARLEIKIKAPPGNSESSLSIYQIDDNQSPTASPALIFDDYFPIILNMTERLFQPNRQEKFPGFLNNPEPIPLVY